MSRNLGPRLKALTRAVARKCPPPPPLPCELTDTEFAWHFARLALRVRERRAAPPEALAGLQERDRREDEGLHRTHPCLFAAGPATDRSHTPNERKDLGEALRRFIDRRAAREVHLDRLDLSAEDREAVAEAVRRLEAALNLPTLPGGPLAYTDLELSPHLSFDVYTRLIEACRRADPGWGRLPGGESPV
jgi:hypothetical protein